MCLLSHCLTSERVLWSVPEGPERVDGGSEKNDDRVNNWFGSRVK